MAAGQVPSPWLWAGALAALALVGYTLYQASGFTLLANRWRRLSELKAGQRHLYRALEALQRRAEGMLAHVPSTVRPAPFAAEDEQAIALSAQLRERLGELREELRPLDPGPRPSLNPVQIALGGHWWRLKEVEEELRFGEAQRRALEAAEGLAGELAAALAALARKPLELQRSLAELQAMAEALGDDIAAEERRGTAGLVSLIYEVQALRKGAMEWAERLRTARGPEAAQVAVEAAALHDLLSVKLWQLLERAQRVIGVHNRALDWQHKVEEALSRGEAELASLRAGVASVLRSLARALRREQEALAARYGEHHETAYQDVAQQAWALAARARTFAAHARRLAEAEHAAAQAVAGCDQAAASLEAEVAEEERRSNVKLDLCRALLARAQRALADLHQMWDVELEGLRPADEATALAALRKVEGLAVACREVQDACHRSLAAWQAQRKRIEGVLERLQASAAEHQRLRGDWRQLRLYDGRNWPQVDAGWYDRYLAERQAILEAAAEVSATLAGGRVAESGGSELRSRCEALDLRWQALLHEGQGLTAALHQVEAVERQVQEGVRALRADVEGVATALAELPTSEPSLGELRARGQRVIDAYRALDEEARHPERTCFAHLRDSALPALQADLAAYRAGYAQAVEREWAQLKSRVDALWQGWEALAARLAKAVPASAVDRAALQQRWQALRLAVRGAPVGLKQALDLAGEASTLAGMLAEAQATFQAEREMVRLAEQRLAHERRQAAQLRDHLPDLLRHAHAQVVGEEWQRSTRAWDRAEALLRQLEQQQGVRDYVALLDQAVELYVDAHSRARSALVHLVRYAYLEDPEGMRTACEPLGQRWSRLGVTAREHQIGDLLGEVERSGQMARLLQRIGQHLGPGP